MKASELINFLSQLPEGQDPDIVTGESWLPEQLIDITFDSEMVNLHFDNAPEEVAGEDEGRGFVEHEIVMIKDRIVKILFDQNIAPKVKADLFLQLFLLAHEKSSTDIVEVMESHLYWNEDSLNR